MTRPNLIDAHVAHARLVEQTALAGGWLAEAHGQDPPGALDEADRALDAVITAARAMKAAIRPQMYRAENAARRTGRATDAWAKGATPGEIMAAMGAAE